MEESVLRLVRLRPPRILFPALCRLSYVVSSSEELNLLHHFIPPSLQSLSIRINTLGVISELNYIIDALRSLACPLTKLSLWSFIKINRAHAETMAHQIARILRFHPLITVLSTKVQVLEQLFPTPALLSQLEEICTATEVPHRPDRFPPILLPKGTFHALTSIKAEEFVFWNRYLLFIGSKIQHILIDNAGEGRTVAATLAEFTTLVGETCRSLLSLHLLPLCTTTPKEEEFVGVLKPLLQCTLLEELVVKFSDCRYREFDLCFMLSDSDVEQMAMARLSLTKLEIITEGPAQTKKPPLTLQAIWFLKQYCPNLCSLAMTLDTTDAISQSNMQNIKDPLLHVLQLKFEDSIILNPADIAQCLLNVCSSENISWTQWQGKSEQDRKWTEMRGHLMLLQLSLLLI
jgi:hypothetical protein